MLAYPQLWEKPHLWQPSYQAGEPDRLMGYAVYTSPYVPTVEAGAAVLAFGFTAWPLLKFLGGERREVHAVSACLGVLFFFNLVCQAWF